MKKRILGAMVALVMILTFLSGCSFLENIGVLLRNNERDYKQVVATITYGGAEKTITKGELVEAYSNYGYSYVDDYDFTVEEALDMLVEQLANKQLLVLYASTRYITAENMTNAEKKEAIDAVNEIMQSSFDSLVVNVRKEITRPQDETTTADEVSTEAARALPNITEDTFNRLDYIGVNDVPASEIPAKFFDTIQSEQIDTETDATELRIKQIALHRLKMLLKSTHYLEYDAAYEYYLNKQFTQLTINWLMDVLYEDIDLDYDILNAAQDEMITSRYNLLLNKNQESYLANPSKYNSDLSSNVKNIIYHPATGYGYVKNILIPFTDEQLQTYSEMKSSNMYSEANLLKYRNETMLSEMSLDWHGDFSEWFENVYNADDYDETNVLIDWRDEVSVVEERMPVYDGTANDLISMITSKVKDDNAALTEKTVRIKAEIDSVNSLIFGYGEDPGMFNNENDYLISPVSTENNWVAEFTELGQVLISGWDGAASYDYITADNIMGTTGEVGAMGWVVTDFGVHIIYVTSIPAEGVDVDGILGLDAVVDYNTSKTVYDLIYDTLLGALKTDKKNAFTFNFLEENKDTAIVFNKGAYSNIIG